MSETATTTDDGRAPSASADEARLLTRLFDASAAAIIAYRVRRDAAGTIIGATVVAVNQPGADALRRPRERLLGRDAWELFSEATRAEHAPVAEEVLRTGVSQTVVRYTPELDRWFRTQIVKLEDDVFANIAVDVTAERRMGGEHPGGPQAAAEREELYRTLFESAPVGVVLVGAEGRISAFNERAHQQLGYTREELARLSIRDIDALDTPETIRGHIERVARHGFDSFTTQHRTRTGELRDVSVTLRAVRVGGYDQILAMHEDFTDARRLAAELQQAQKLESIGRLAGGVAHDFNNLLTVILGCAETLTEGLETTTSPWLLDDVEEIRRAGRRASELTRQLLTFARKQVISPIPLDLSSVVHGSEKMLRRLLGEDITIHARLTEGLRAVLCDPGLVEQVILNLAVNARDAMPRGGSLTIETAEEELMQGREPGMPPGDYVRLSIEDDGEGMSDEVKAHLFEPFFTTKPQGRGTGLGLATVYGIVKQSHGHIEVRSTQGKGTRFDVYFPAVDEAPESLGSAHARPVEGTETVLLVEDEPAVRVVTKRMLEERGYRVLAAESAAEAIAVARAEAGAIDLLVTDVIMPAGSGRDVAEAVVTERPDTRVLFVSGYTSDVLEGYAVADSGLDFLAKPFTGAELAARVREILDGARRPARA